MDEFKNYYYPRLYDFPFRNRFLRKFEEDLGNLKNVDYSDFKKFLNKQFSELKEKKEKYYRKAKIATLIIWPIAAISIVLGLLILQDYISILILTIITLTFAIVIHCASVRRYLSSKYVLNRSQSMILYDLRRHYKRSKPDLVNTSNPFSYLDGKLISDLYVKLITHEKIVSIEEQRTIKKGKDFIGKIPKLIEAKYSSLGSQIIKQQKELVDSPLVQYNQLEEYFYDKDLLNFNLEKFDLTKTNYNELSEIFRTISNKFGVEIEGKDTYLNQIQVAYAKEKLVEISNISGYIYLTAQFEVLEKDDKITELSFTHPITNFLYNSTEKKSVQFNIKCISANIQDFGKQTFVKGKSNKITCLGKIIRWDSEMSRLDIYPIAIY